MKNCSVSLLLLAFAAAALAQTLSSTLDGLVKDSQGALIPRAEVTVTNTRTAQTFQTVTDEKGHWFIASLPTGVYGVAVTAPGFKKATATDVKMDAGIPASVCGTLPSASIRKRATAGCE